MRLALLFLMLFSLTGCKTALVFFAERHASVNPLSDTDEWDTRITLQCERDWDVRSR